MSERAERPEVETAVKEFAQFERSKGVHLVAQPDRPSGPMPPSVAITVDASAEGPPTPTAQASPAAPASADSD